mmetsp:Transcript_10514/g.26469  ORF Transcript_10514/g.26469 Transcript_10514/m.26469 type:complete len:212 (-) Transcript_10514:147-782(-)
MPSSGYRTGNSQAPPFTCRAVNAPAGRRRRPRSSVCVHGRGGVDCRRHARQRSFASARLLLPPARAPTASGSRGAGRRPSRRGRPRRRRGSTWWPSSWRGAAVARTRQRARPQTMTRPRCDGSVRRSRRCRPSRRFPSQWWDSRWARCSHGARSASSSHPPTPPTPPRRPRAEPVRNLPGLASQPQHRQQAAEASAPAPNDDQRACSLRTS